MRVSRRFLALAVAAALVAGVAVVLLVDERRKPAAPLLAQRPTIVQDDAQVLHRSTAEVRRTVRVLRALGVDWLRVTANWSFVAPAPASPRRPDFDAADPGAYPPGAWAKLDRAVRLARESGLEVMIDVAFWAPRWAVRRASAPAERQRWGIDAPEYARFATAVARRYGERAIGFTVWNEPNYGVFLLPQWRRTAAGWEVASADEYRAMVHAAVPALRRHAPRALVLIGGTAAQGATAARRPRATAAAHRDELPRSASSAVAPLAFLRALACVDEALRPVRAGGCARFRPLPGDGWAHHPYSPGAPPDRSDPRPDTAAVADVRRLADLLDRLHAAGRTQERLAVWVNEFGYETDPPDPTQRVSLAEQARWLPEAEAIALAEPRVRSWSQFLLRDLGPVPGARGRQRWADFQSGLELPDGRGKPAMRAFSHPLVARRAGPGTVAFWGRVRPGAGRAGRWRVRVSALSAGGGWEPLRASPAWLLTAPDGTFSGTVAADPRATFRLEVRRGGRWSAPGVPVRAAG